MYKTLLKVAFVVAIAMVAGINVFNAQKPEALSDVAMANVEALADDEGSNKTCKWMYVKDDYGCPLHVCVESGNGEPCVCGTDRYI